MKKWLSKIMAVLKSQWFIRIYLLVLLVWVAVFFYWQREEIPKIFSQAQPLMFLGAISLYIFVVAILNPYLHSKAYFEIGSPVTFWQAFRIFHLSRIGNYLPGRVWFATNYYIFSKKLNINTEKITKNFVVLNALLFLVGSLCSLPIIALLSPTVQKLLIAIPFFMLALIHPKVLNRVFKPLVGKNSGKHFSKLFLLKVGCLYLVAYLALGVAMYFCVLAYQTIDFSHMPLLVAAASSSLILGLLAIFAPAGLGVREGMSTFILSQIIPLGVAVMAVLSLRLMTTLVDFSCALVSSVSVAREKSN